MKERQIGQSSCTRLVEHREHPNQNQPNPGRRREGSPCIICAAFTHFMLIALLSPSVLHSSINIHSVFCQFRSELGLCEFCVQRATPDKLVRGGIGRNDCKIPKCRRSVDLPLRKDLSNPLNCVGKEKLAKNSL